MVVCDVDRLRFWLARSSCTSCGNSCASARAWPSPLHSDRWERSCLWLSSLPELVREVHQAHHSTTPNRALSAAQSMFQLAEGSDLWNLWRLGLLIGVFFFFCETSKVSPIPSVSFFFLRRACLSSSKSISSIAIGLVLTAAILRSLSRTLLSRRS